MGFPCVHRESFVFLVINYHLLNDLGGVKLSAVICLNEPSDSQCLLQPTRGRKFV